MVPSSIRSNLAGLRTRERLLTLVWGLACWLAVTIVLLIACCLVDWLYDREQDTPFLVRFFLFLVQLTTATAAGIPPVMTIEFYD